MACPEVLGEHQCVIAKIRAKCGLSVVLLDEFEPKDALSKMSSRSKVAGTEPDIAELFDCYHVHLPGGSRLVEPVSRMQECSGERLQSALRRPYILLEKVWILEGSGMC